LAASLLPMFAAAMPNAALPEAALPFATPARPLADASEDAKSKIVEAIRRKYNAQLVRVTDATVDGKKCYEIRLRTDERLWTVRVDAETGQEVPES
jgi:hypothetical protein